MPERLRASEEVAGAILSKTLDTLFEATVCEVFEGENAEFLKDLGLAISYSYNPNNPNLDRLTIANWNTLDIVRVTRAEEDIDISYGLPFKVRFQIELEDMLSNKYYFPFKIDDQEVQTEKLRFAVTTDTAAVPWVTIPGDSGTSLYFVKPEHSIGYLPEHLLVLFEAMQAKLLIDLYGESDPFNQIEF